MSRSRRALAAKLILALAAVGIAAGATLSARPSTPIADTGGTAKAVAPVQTASAAPVSHAPPAMRPSPAPKPTPAPMVVKRVLDIGPIRFGDFAWDSSGVPDGPVVITVDLAAQTLSVFRDGYEIGATAILYGTDDKPTPLGTFAITQKDADHVSNLYGAPMPYMLRLTDDGVSIHGTEVEWGYATHGCIGVPTAFARKLFAVARRGDRVIITRGKTLGMGGALT